MKLLAAPGAVTARLARFILQASIALRRRKASVFPSWMMQVWTSIWPKA
jgi:hypothetical protein